MITLDFLDKDNEQIYAEIYPISFDEFKITIYYRDKEDFILINPYVFKQKVKLHDFLSKYLDKEDWLEIEHMVYDSDDSSYVDDDFFDDDENKATILKFRDEK